MKTQKISILLKKRFTTPNWIKVNVGLMASLASLYYLNTLFHLMFMLNILTAQGTTRSSHVCWPAASRGLLAFYVIHFFIFLFCAIFCRLSICADCSDHRTSEDISFEVTFKYLMFLWDFVLLEHGLSYCIWRIIDVLANSCHRIRFTYLFMIATEDRLILGCKCLSFS